MLYRWNDRKFEKKYLRKLKEVGRSGSLFF